MAIAMYVAGVRPSGPGEEPFTRPDAIDSASNDGRQSGKRPSRATGDADQRFAGGQPGDPVTLQGDHTAAQIEADRVRQLRQLEASFARDRPDPIGAGTTVDVLERTAGGDIMRSTGFKPAAMDIACKQNSCRIVGTFDKISDAQDWGLFFITAAGGNVLAQSRMVLSPTSSGMTEARIYAARPR